MYLGAPDPPYDDIDSACDGGLYEWDADQDGQEIVDHGGTDCDDTDPEVYEGATGDIWYDGVDTNCDGLNDCDRDGDTFEASFGPSCDGDDCDDGNAGINPGEAGYPAERGRRELQPQPAELMFRGAQSGSGR